MTPVPTCRFGDRCTLATYEDAIECLGSHSDKTRTEIARSAAQQQPGKSETYFRSCLSPHDGTHNLQLAAAPAFYLASGNPALLRWHAQACGFGIYRLPSAGGSRRDTLLAIADVTISVGDMVREVRDAKRDDQITAREAQAFTLRAQQTIAELVTAIATVNLEVEPARVRA